MPDMPFVDVATGSLGCGLSCATGMAYAHKYMYKSNVRIYTIVGDGELMEGSNWEALAFSDKYKLNNMVMILDLNKMGQSSWSAYSNKDDWNDGHYKSKLESFGWTVYVADGHNVDDLATNLEAAKNSDKPVCIIAKTLKGGGSTVENVLGWHGKPLDADNFEKTIQILEAKVNKEIPNQLLKFVPSDLKPRGPVLNSLKVPDSFVKKVSTRRALGDAVVNLLDNDDAENFR